MARKMQKWVSCLLLVLLITATLPVTAFAYSWNQYGAVTTNTRYNFDLNSGWALTRYSFTPSVTGYYQFYSTGRQRGDPYFYLTNSANYSIVRDAIVNNGAPNSTAAAYSLTCNDDSNGDSNFSASYLCYAGQTYYCMLTKYGSVSNWANADFYINGPYYNTASLNRNGGSGGSSYYYNNGSAWLYTNSGSATNYISVPTRPNYTFVGYYTASSGGTQYIDSSGYISSARRSYNGTLYAQWQQNVYTLTLNNQGASNTSQTISAGNALPASLSVPVRTGYTFNGYYTVAAGGTQYYNASGSRNAAYTMSGNQTLYAQWSPKGYSITYNGLSGAAISGNPATHFYGSVTAIPNPAKAEYTFMGWSINGGTALTKNLILSTTGYTANIVLTANWKKTTDVSITDEEGLAANTAANQADLAKAFDRPVEDPAVGVTSDELSNSDSVVLSLKVTSSTGTPEGESAIQEASQGDVVKFFDAKVTKEITVSGATTTTNLAEIPVPVAVSIPLSGSLADKNSYAVYRYHSYTGKDGETLNEIQRLSDDPANAEYFEVDAGNIVIHTRMFSLFAIAAGETSVDIVPPHDGGEGDGAGMDVQGKIVQTGVQPIYKIDVAWGSMLFKFTTAREWDPNNHVYGAASYKWADDSFIGGNNEITMTNHSNADVHAQMSFARKAGQLEATDVTFREVNAGTADIVTQYYLPKVETENGDAPMARSYLWLSGTPTTLPGGVPQAGGETAVTRVGTITITFAADTSTGLTPKNS